MCYTLLYTLAYFAYIHVDVGLYWEEDEEEDAEGEESDGDRDSDEAEDAFE